MDLSNSNIDLTGDWLGWRQRGRWFVSDDGQRITVERLRGLLWREQMELYRQGFASRRQAEQARRLQRCGGFVIARCAAGGQPACLKSEGPGRRQRLRNRAGEAVLPRLRPRPRS